MTTMQIKKGLNILVSVNNPICVPRIGEYVGFKVGPNQTESRRVINVEYVFDGNSYVIIVTI